MVEVCHVSELNLFVWKSIASVSWLDSPYIHIRQIIPRLRIGFIYQINGAFIKRARELESISLND